MGLLVSSGREGWFLFLLGVLCLMSLGGVSLYELHYASDLESSSRPLFGKGVAIAKDMAQLSILSTVLTVMIVEGFPMLAERLNGGQYDKGREDRDQEWLANPQVAALVEAGELRPPTIRNPRR